MNIEAMRARLSAITDELRTIHTEAGESNLTEDQQSRWDALETEERETAEAVRVAEETAARDARVAERRARWGSVQVSPVRVDPFDNLEALRHADEGDLISRALTATESVRYAGAPFAISDEARQNATRMIESVPGAAALALAHGSPAYMSAFRSWLTSGGQPVYSQDEAMAVRAAMSLTSANGGYALPFLLDPTLIHTGTATKNPIRRIARVVTGTQNVWHGVTVSNVTTAWKGEGSAFTDGAVTTGTASVTAAALTAYVTASYEIFQDSSIQSQLPGLIAESIDFAESTAFVSGSGSTAPKGIVTAISATVASTVTATTRGSFTSASTADTLALLNALPVRYEDTSTWLMNKATYRTINQQVTGTAGVQLIEQTDRNNLLDLPVLRSSDMVSATTSGNVLIVLGDFSQFVIYDRLGVSLEFIPNVVDGSGIPTGQRGLVAFKRVGSDCTDINAFRFLKC